MDGVRFEAFLHGDDRPVLFVVATDVEGAWTPAPNVVIESGNFLELTEAELAWLVEDSGPKALVALRAAATEEG